MIQRWDAKNHKWVNHRWASSDPKVAVRELEDLKKTMGESYRLR
ncbi:hypothetical protein HWB05_gp108 [Streptomyces phage BRock]|uniref:Uncharacterized protein n=1 Tax=Streptomyces phage BRock TaxID=1913591 RepID=A0A1J0GW03_9CAUD|nr:hypothetical protein HWB05_gp108 [Streptomyces phage BRock]APC46370.1 hypothetical protein [Streptomyces phage BRock]